MDERARRIVSTAVELAEKGGFEAVRLRDVASSSGVALGTLYRHFRSKEDLLVAALTEEIEQLEQRMDAHPAAGTTSTDRVSSFFSTATNGLCRRPMLAKAMLRATTSGLPELTEKVAAFHGRMTGMIAAAIRGNGAGAKGDSSFSDDEICRGALLMQVWFASLVGWSGGVHDKAAAIDQVRVAAAMLLDD
ncbi:MAG: TetR family transcriptional regulator [Candidatus Binatia bacterium]